MPTHRERRFLCLRAEHGVDGNLLRWSERRISRRSTRLKNQLSVRGFDRELARRIRELARRERMSLNKAALILMRRGAGLSDDATRDTAIGGALDEFIGTWSAAEEERILKSVEPFETVD